MKRERIVRTENIDRQRIKYRVLFGFIFIMCCNRAALPSEDGKMPDWKFSFSLKRIPMIRIFDEIEQKVILSLHGPVISTTRFMRKSVFVLRKNPFKR